MKAGTRAVGIAASDGATEGDPSVLCGAVVRADRVVDGFSFATCTVGGTDATSAMASLPVLGRDDVQFVFLAGVAPAWFNVVDLPRLGTAVDRPVLAVSFEASAGLEPALREAFAGEALEDRLAVYERLPPRRRVSVNGETVFVRTVGCDSEDDAADVVRAFTPEGGRPEPLRVARLAARGARERFLDGA
ncbi:endonuclease dU [Salinigranum rubrum]|uniref:endonuclease dU n=1 Tax=Salinigranum rubrum TaxID=755307 RepID=UPI0037445706